jgi:DUF971 family protein
MPDNTQPEEIANGAVHPWATPTGTQKSPQDLELSLSEQRLTVTWSDGEADTYVLPLLRRHCPCATCREEREKQESTLLPILSEDPGDIPYVVDAKLIGRYALQLIWSDGHSTGMFDFHLLRRLAPEAKPRSS